MRPHVSWELLSLLRFVLACVVAFGHVRWFAHDDTVVAAFDSFGGKAAVVGFLVVSGFSIRASLDHSSKHFYRRRFLRIYPLYFTAVLSTVIIQASLGTVHTENGRTFEPDGAAVVAGNFLLLQTFVVKPVVFDVPLWSLSIECFFYLIAPLLLRLPLYATLSLIVASGAVYLTPRSGEWGQLVHLLTRVNAVVYLWPWLVGFVLFRTTSPLSAVALAAATCAVVGLNVRVNPEPLAPAMIALTFVVLFLSRHLNAPGRAKALFDFLGDVSYPLYLLHFPILILGHDWIGMRDPWALLGLALLASVLAYYLVDVLAKAKVVVPIINCLLRSRMPATSSA